MTFLAIFAVGAALLTGSGQAAASAPAPGSAAQAPAAHTPAVHAYWAYIDTRWPAGQPVTPVEVAAMITRDGAQRTVGALWGEGDTNRWATVARGIARGEPAWLAIAPRLAGGTDAGTSDEFAMAVQDALVANAPGALRLISGIPMGTGACAENSFETPAAQSRAYYAAAIASVGAVTEPALATIRDACLAELRRGAAALQR